MMVAIVTTPNPNPPLLAMTPATSVETHPLSPNAVESSSNLYSSPAFLEVIARVYFPSKRFQIQNCTIGGQTFRLLNVEGHGPVVEQTFLDIHEPLPGAPNVGTLPGLRRLAGVGTELISVDVLKSAARGADIFGAPTARWAEFETWEDYLGLLKRRRVLADDMRRRRRLEESFGVLEYRADDVADDVLPTCFEWKSARDREAGRQELFASEANRQFFLEMRSRGMLRVSSLRAGGRLLAVWLGAIHDKRWSGWVFVFNNDPSLSKFSVGRQLLYFMLEESYRSGHEELDFSIGMEPYKLFFATHVRVVAPIGTRPFGQRVRDFAKGRLIRWPRLLESMRVVKRLLAGQFSVT